MPITLRCRTPRRHFFPFPYTHKCTHKLSTPTVSLLYGELVFFYVLEGISALLEYRLCRLTGIVGEKERGGDEILDTFLEEGLGTVNVQQFQNSYTHAHTHAHGCGVAVYQTYLNYI